jgi:ferredoxin
MTKYEVKVDLDNCIACGTCYSAGAEHFEQDAGGLAIVVGGNKVESFSIGVFDDDNFKLAKSTAGYCPVEAITVNEKC